MGNARGNQLERQLDAHRKAMEEQKTHLETMSRVFTRLEEVALGLRSSDGGYQASTEISAMVQQAKQATEDIRRTHFSRSEDDQDFEGMLPPSMVSKMAAEMIEMKDINRQRVSSVL